MGPPVLVQDVVDMVIDSVANDDIKTLRQCSLVATNWVHRSQSHIFKTIEWTRGCPHLPEWVQTVGPKRDDLLSHTSNLCLFDLSDAEGLVFELCKLPQLRAFQNIGRLPLSDHRFLIFLYSNVGRSLRMLLLHRTRINRATLINAISFFPLLDYLYLHGISIRDPDCKVFCPAPRRPLTGELSMSDYQGYPPIIAQLSVLPFRFTEIQIKVRDDVLDRPGIGLLIEQSSHTLRSFTILRDGQSLFRITGISLSSCRGLRELRVSIYNFSRPQEPFPTELLSTIDSPDFAKLILTIEQPAGYNLCNGGLIINRSMWDRFDSQLCSWMENRLGMGAHREGFELVFELALGSGPKRLEGKFAAEMPDYFLSRVRTIAQISFIVVNNPVPYT